jgi:hypothetical protein
MDAACSNSALASTSFGINLISVFVRDVAADGAAFEEGEAVIVLRVRKSLATARR